jgi:hypothetical protein
MAWVIDPTQEFIKVNGIPIEGAPATGVRLSWEYPDNVVESFGGVTPGYSLSASRRASISITLAQGSHGNRILLNTLKLQVGAVCTVTARRVIPGALAEILVAPTAMILKAPAVTWQTGDAPVTWVLESAAATGGPVGLPDAPTINPEDI